MSVPYDRDVIVQPYFKAIFEEKLDAWYRVKSAWPSPSTYETFLAWFEVEVHSMILDLQNRWLTAPNATTEWRR